MKIAITGASGLIGSYLAAALLEDGHQLHVLSRRAHDAPRPGVQVSRWDPANGPVPEAALQGTGAVINLAGEPVAQRWTTAAKERILESRVQVTRRLLEAFSVRPDRPAVLISCSGVGIYGSRGDEVLTESSPPGGGFLAGVVQEWEQQADLAEALGIRVVKLRLAMVLSARGGALGGMLPAFRAGVGGRLGSGRQWMSWIHIDDVASLVRFALRQPVAGPLNAAAPAPVTNAEFTRALAEALRRPAVLPVPVFALRLLFGEMADVLLDSQRVLPEAAIAAGFRFRYPALGGALAALLQ